jgi:hypothetical protein
MQSSHIQSPGEMNTDEDFLSEDCSYSEENYTLSKLIAAIQLVPTGGGTARLGVISQLLPGVQFRLCGKGFNEQTVKVRCQNGFYFVFSQDIAADQGQVAREV